MLPDRIEYLPVSELKFDPKNSRKHPTRNIDSIKESLRRFGQQKPIVIDATNTVVAGNGFLQAARELGWSQILCIKTDLEGAEAMAFAIADNRTAELAEWDMEALAASLKEIRLTDEELLKATGWAAEISKVVKPVVEPVRIYQTETGFTSTPEQYEAASIRQLVVLYERSKYEAVVERLDAEMEERNLQSHAAVIAVLLGLEP
jgi:hypothetical protein